AANVKIPLFVESLPLTLSTSIRQFWPRRAPLAVWNDEMSDISCILSAAQRGDAHAAEELLPLVYAELRRLAAQKLALEKPGQTLDSTALVHEAYLRLVPRGPSPDQQQWDGRGHFFAAAAEAMRRILVESARRKARIKHGGGKS